MLSLKLRSLWAAWFGVSLALLPNTALGAAVLKCGDGLRIHQLELGPMKNYQYLIEDGQVGVSVDAAWSIGRLTRYAEKLGVRLAGGLYTHGHFDHIGGAVPGQNTPPAEGVEALLAYLTGSRNDAGHEVWLGTGDLEMATAQTNLKSSDWTQVADGDVLHPLGNKSTSPEVVVVDSPGHTPGGVSYLLRGHEQSGLALGPSCGSGVLFTGDSLFLTNVGRTDLPGGDRRTLLKTLSRLSQLEDDVIVLPGHSYDAPPKRASLAEVRRKNAFVQQAMKDYPANTLRPLPAHAISLGRVDKQSSEL